MEAPSLDTTAVETQAPLDPEASLLSPEIAARLGRLSILARRLSEARRRGRRKNRRIGGSAEMIDTRSYVLGDDPRRIAWPAYARLEKLVVRLAADEAPLRLALVVDTSASMAYGAPTKLRQAARVAAGLAAVGLSSEDRVAAVGTSSRGLDVLRATGGRGGLAKLLALLEGMSAGGETSVVNATHAVASAAGGRALCVILGDMLDPAGALAGARAARARGHEVALVEVLDPLEIEPPDLDDAEVEDEETGEVVLLPPTGVREMYAEALARHRAEIDDGAAELGAPVLRVTTEEPFDAVVGAALQVGLLRGGAL